MKTKAISSFFVLFAIAAGIVAMTPGAFADHSQVTIEAAAGSGAPGCEETAEGCYIPSTATVDVGGEVIFSNTDSAAHTFTSGDPTVPESVQVLFDSGLVMAGSTYSWSPTETGDVPYFCMVHPWMQGLIVVQEAGAAEEDDHGDDHGDEMMMPTGAASATGMLSDGTKVSVWTTAPTKGEMLEISVQFEGAEHVNHDMKVTQNGNTVLDDKGAHHHDGKGVHMTKALGSSDPVNITITFQGYGVDDPKTGPIGEEVVFSNVVPEFGTIAMMILAVAIISIVAVTAKSRVVPRF
ncbi:PEFG-CTERM sorting domain-containing protein [Nitrosopumilus sp.]|uniref:PEFG-CTERM sorting domain-containing protein n=1 Tax=Nitrosopumilus sp. TaxID=2024843 RepID=UPI00247E0532|nr:PEFG-CTERM sorting domain-containing protein [Nitrosopumilus sp.]MCV0430900.1 PEFG-CTERM sorting domain-containing protein [Nitrosopumilus sp.]